MTGMYAPAHGIYTVNSSERGEIRTRRIIPAENKGILDDGCFTLAESVLRQPVRRRGHAFQSMSPGSAEMTIGHGTDFAGILLVFYPGSGTDNSTYGLYGIHKGGL